MKTFTRRNFIKLSGGALAASTLAPAAGLMSSKRAPSDTVSIGLIGCRNMGYWILFHALNQPGVVCGGLCDVDRNILEDRAADVEEQTGSRPALYGDYRELLEQNDLDAVIIGTPDHWHCLQTIHALEAGKHVYVEKPLANTIAECELIRKAQERYGHVVQVGQQQRSGEHWQDVVREVRTGELGAIRHVKIWGNFMYGRGPASAPDEPVPEGVDYDMWLGPASERPFNRNRFHGSWRFFWEYGGGLITDWGAHLFDIPLWAMDIDGPPVSVSSAGGIFSGEDRDIDMADTQSVIYQFDHFNLTWEHNGGIQSGPWDRNYGIAFIGNNGTLIANREGWEIKPEVVNQSSLMDAVPPQTGAESNHEAHVANFIDCIRSGDEPLCPVGAGVLAAFYGHIGNIAHRTGRRMEWDGQGRLKDLEEYANLITPRYRGPWRLPEL